MLSINLAWRSLALVIAAAALTACHNGGDLTLEPGARKVASQGSPFIQVNLGGKAMVVQQGQTPDTGVHGWIHVNAVSSQNLTSPNSTSLILNRAQAFQ
jgi:hypothetical protein